MFIRSTSIEAYRKIKEEGLLSERRFATYDALFRYGPCTGMELLDYMKRAGMLKTGVDSQIRARLNELRKVGVAWEVGTRECRITKQNVIVWDVTTCLPVKLEKPKRKKCHHCQGKGYFESTQAKMF